MRAARSLVISLTSCLLALTLFAGCGSSGKAETQNATFVGAASNAVILVQWVRDGNELNGSVQQSILADETGRDMDSSNDSFTGTINDGAVSLRLEKGLGDTSTLVGQTEGESLKLTYPGVDGKLLELDMLPGSISDFNSAVALLAESNVATSCTLYASNHDAKLEFEGESAGDSCDMFKETLSAETATWTTDGQDAVGREYTPVCWLSDGANLVNVSDTGEQAYGKQACEDLRAAGWTEPLEK